MRLRTEDLSTRSLGDEMVLLDLRTSRYLSVTGVGVEIVTMLAEDRSEDDLVDALLARYDVDEDVIRRDTSSFLEELRVAGLLEQ